MVSVSEGTQVTEQRHRMSQKRVIDTLQNDEGGSDAGDGTRVVSHIRVRDSEVAQNASLKNG
jgi:hypothetical protein